MKPESIEMKAPDEQNLTGLAVYVAFKEGYKAALQSRYSYEDYFHD